MELLPPPFVCVRNRKHSPFPEKAMDHDDLPPPTMRSPISTLRVRDHVVAVEVQEPRPTLTRIRPRLRSGAFPISRLPATPENEVPTRRLGAA